MGGGDPPTDSVELIDLNVADPAWLEMDPMASPRRHHNATVLPDGTSLVTGGTECAGFNCAAGAVLEAELWDPETKKWSTLAPMEIPRLYHSTAILLPDGRVLIAGGGRPAADGEVDNHNAELFSPPYLFKGPRPTILSAPPAASWGDTFLVETPDALEISNVTLVRLGSVTHAFDQNQRFLTLSASAAPGSVMVIMPSNPNFAPPGHYMLFLVNGNGVPSVASMIRVDPAADLSLACSSTVLTVPGLRDEVENLTTNPNTKKVLNKRLDQTQSALDVGRNDAARNRIKSFMAIVVSRSNQGASRPTRIPLAQANAIHCSAANVLSSIPLEGALEPTMCSSYVAALVDLRAEVEALGITMAARKKLVRDLDKVQKALDAGNNKTARGRLKSFVVRVIGQSHLRDTHRRAIGVSDADGLVCSSANVLNGILP